MKRHAAAWLLALVLVPAPPGPARTPRRGPTGKTGSALQRQEPRRLGPEDHGYEVGVNFGNTFRVENGVLKVAYDQYDEFRRQVRPPVLQDAFSHYVLGWSTASWASRRRTARTGPFATAAS